ncbi:MAG TPA: Lpg1974 family pore-forming outer membrane protein, partial [Pirellulales bacterium]
GIFFRPWDREAAYVQDPNSQPGRWEQSQQIISNCQPCPVTPPFVGADFFNTNVRTPGFVGGVEVLFLKPFQGFKAPASTLPVANPQTAAFNYDAAQRYWLGYVLDDGLGLRARYFDFDRGANPATQTVGAQTQNINGTVRSRQLDLELTQQVSFRRWSLLTFGGMRYGELLQSSGVRELDAGANTFLASENSFHGLGVTGGLQAQRALGWCPYLSFYFFGRGSLLFGNQRYNATSFDNAAGTATSIQLVGHNDNMMIWELGLGPQWQMPLACGGSFFARGGLEAQIYQPSASGTIDSGNMGLAGFSFAMGINR